MTLLEDLSATIPLLLSRSRQQVTAMARERDGTPGLELHALREIADMAYRNHDTALVEYAHGAGLSFGHDLPSQYKIDLTPLSDEVRLSSILNLLATKRTLREEDSFLIQLAVDFGPTASQAAGARLIVMRTADADTFPPMGFAALFRVIRGCGDRQQREVVEQFLTSNNSTIVYYARQTSPDISLGIPRQYRINY